MAASNYSVFFSMKNNTVSKMFKFNLSMFILQLLIGFDWKFLLQAIEKSAVTITINSPLIFLDLGGKDLLDCWCFFSADHHQSGSDLDQMFCTKLMT